MTIAASQDVRKLTAAGVLYKASAPVACLPICQTADWTVPVEAMRAINSR